MLAEDIPREDLKSMSFLTYVGPTSNRINTVLSRHYIKTVDLPSRKVTKFLQFVKDDFGLKTRGVYGIVCECSIETRIKEHHWHTWP
jgi:hypothetical protein